MQQDEIKTILPHRDNMLLLDQLDKEGDIAHGQYRVRGDEWFLQGHFPGAPVVRDSGPVGGHPHAGIPHPGDPAHVHQHEGRALPGPGAAGGPV